MLRCIRKQFVVIPAWIAFLLLVGSLNAAETDTAGDILQATGVKGGVIVHLGCGDGKLTAALRVSDRYQVHGLARDPAEVAKARGHVAAGEHYGEVSIDRLSGNRLPYVDNLVNLVVAEDLADVTVDELLRVLVPNGVAYIKSDDGWKKTVKPWPDDIDEWTHFLHDAGGNAVAHDDVVGPPRHLQWLGSPRWSRHHDRMASMSALVSAGGRLFYIMDEGSRISIQMPPKWMLVARDAFNGTILWKQPIPTWQSHLWPLKSGPTQLARRLVAEGDRVYVTLGLQAPVTVMDAATGEIIRTVEGSDPTEELIVSNGTLLALVNKGSYETKDFLPAFNTGDQARVRTDKQFHWNEQAREVVGINGDNGDVLWRRESVVGPLSLAADTERVYFYNGQGVVCLDRESGKELWASEPAGRAQDFTMNFGPKLVVHDNVVLFAGGDRKMVALAAATGKQMWTAPHARGGYQSPEDLLVASGLVWSAPTTSGRDSGIWTGRDLLTGEVKNEFPPNVDTYWFHHRCYFAKATDKFLIPSRTGIEFVDHEKQDWDIHHWVRGGCLYGVMPCNGLLYAPPHNCACYPEAKLFGMNALAPASTNREVPKEVSDEGRLERGPAYDNIVDAPAKDTDWPTYRHDAARSGYLKQDVPATLKSAWKTNFDSKLSSVVIANDKLFVAEVDRHTVHALNANTGETVWSYTAGGRVDSPPTIHKGRAIFGAADGWMYCLRASDGELAWRFRAAPRDERLMAFEQLESVWPVHGSVLVEKDVVYFIAGRSNFLDGGMRFFRVHAETGRKISEGLMDDRDPHTGEDLQNHIKVLQMPVALPDILSSDSVYVYLRSQQIDMEGNRLEIGPHSADFAGQGSVQRGPTQHLFAPMGFLDDTWFHRAYWVYGRSFAGGHAGYYQAGKYTPSGRLLVFDDDNVYGYGRKPEYLKWTTTIEHQLFASGKEPPPQARSEADEPTGGRRNAPAASTMIRFGKPAGINPTGKPLTVEAWVQADRPDGVVVAHGGPAVGYALVLQGGKPQFLVRTKDKVTAAKSNVETIGRWTHLVGVLSEDKQVKLYINGRLVDKVQAPSLLPSNPAQGLEIGADDAGAVGDYRSPLGFTGMIDEVRIYHAALSDDEIADHASSTDRTPTDDRRLVLACTFEGGTAEDVSGNGHDGELDSPQSVKGKFGRAMQFTFRQSQAAGSFVEYLWTQDVPLMVRAMAKANDKLFIAGPPDLIDEEQTFQRTMARDPNLASLLVQQDDALSDEAGGLMRVVSAIDGNTLAEYKLDSLPSWDGMAAANGKLFMSTTDGNVICYAAN
ncbi:MAG TPA: PQQ-binding-like beta-propeller repeat protein [Pirellulaceae bacterium]|nr:PQQ-binding-like beta-propeller repeat protein [Pirellulaceae bacterium]